MDLTSVPLEDVPACILCHSPGEVDTFPAKLLSLPKPYHILICKECKLRWLSPRPTKEAYKLIYQGDHYFIKGAVPENYRDVAEERRPLFQYRLSKIKKNIGHAVSLLDVGAATGDFVALASEMKFTADGIELSEWARHEAFQRHGIHLRTECLSDIPDRQYGVVHMNHVLEHLVDPIKDLMEIKRVLDDNGMLVIEVPNQFENIVELRHRFLRKDNSRPFSLYSIHHPFFYTPRSLKSLLSICGFRIRNCATWNSRIRRGSMREKLLLFLGDFFAKRGDFIEIYAVKGDT